MPATRVLYVHGLESGPHGRKPRALASAGFDVVSEQMPCGRAQIARDPVVLGGAALGAGLVVGCAIRGGLLGAALVLGTGFASARFASSRLMRRVVRRSLDVQTGLLARHPIDVVVGSSFGGAIALELLVRGAWSGPTVLLCPAHALVANRARRPLPPTLAALPDAIAARVVVVHGRSDTTVPLAHSEALVAGSRARLVIVDDDHRLSTTATPERLATWVAMAQTPAT